MGITLDTVPDMGRRDYMVAPIDISFIYPDINEGPIPVFLCIKAGHSPIEPVHPSARHWAIVWEVRHFSGRTSSTHAFRQLHVTRERDRNGIPCDHLTNWGPMTKALTDLEISQARFLPLGDLWLSQRRRLEEIAARTPAQMPDGKYHCQHWIFTVLKKAVTDGVLDIDLDGIRAQALSV